MKVCIGIADADLLLLYEYSNRIRFHQMFIFCSEQWWYDNGTMYFKRVNDTTITCVITEKDLADNGIEIDDLFERKKEAMEYLKSVILEAAHSENFRLDGEYTSMRITVLPDHSISLTLSENKSRIKVNDLRGLSRPASEDSAEYASAPEMSGKGAPGMVNGKATYGFVFDTINETIECCRQVVRLGGCDSSTQSVYLDEEYMTYYLFLTSVVRDDPEFNRMVLELNEFGDLFNEGPAAMAFIREHGKCIVKDNAAKILADL